MERQWKWREGEGLKFLQLLKAELIEVFEKPQIFENVLGEN